MTPGDREALEALQRRLTHAEAIAGCIAEPHNTQFGEAVRGIETMLSDIGETLDRFILEAARRAS